MSGLKMQLYTAGVLLVVMGVTGYQAETAPMPEKIQKTDRSQVKTRQHALMKNLTTEPKPAPVRLASQREDGLSDAEVTALQKHLDYMTLFAVYEKTATPAAKAKQVKLFRAQSADTRKRLQKRLAQLRAKKQFASN